MRGRNAQESVAFIVGIGILNADMQEQPLASAGLNASLFMKRDITCTAALAYNRFVYTKVAQIPSPSLAHKTDIQSIDAVS